ncbi:MAG: TonB-dependent receptor, partial [Bacteriovoracaceae bacterium]|nr:TonB-dependent receptor [Bacteriovoracaceae bacterium]
WIVRDNYFIPNVDLKHEVSANKEAGFSTKKYIFDYLGSVSFKASIYENKVKDYIKIERIDRSVMDSEDGTSQYINIPDVSLYGGEAELGVNYDIFEWKVAYSQVRGKNETDGLYLEDLPADQYTYSFNVYLDKYRAQFGYLGVQAQEQNRTNPETLQRTEKTPAYFIHNIYGKKDIGENFEVGLRIDNLGNKEYRRHGSFLNEAKEDYKITVKYKINTL